MMMMMMMMLNDVIATKAVRLGHRNTFNSAMMPDFTMLACFRQWRSRAANRGERNRDPFPHEKNVCSIRTEVVTQQVADTSAASFSYSGNRLIVTNN